MALLRSSLISSRAISSSCRVLMPYKPEERLPLTERQKRLYPQVEQEFTEEGFPILKLMPSKKNMFADRRRVLRRRTTTTFVPREQAMPEDQDWPSVWPVAKTFVPSAVPLPMRQSYEEKPTRVPRGKYCNTELIKVANFLHLTPVAINRHCKALQRFCTEWPKELDTDEDVRSHFPVTHITRDYINSAPTIRDHRARIVTLVVNIKDLKLDPIDEDKMIRLAGNKYDPSTGEIAIPASSCPTKIQNQDYADYMLTALYFESIKHEKWEEDKPEIDWERFYWDKSESKQKVKDYLEGKEVDQEQVVDEYKKCLELVYEKKDKQSYDSYRSTVEKMLGFQAR